ncbi:MAG: hypothetical protein V1857_05720 [archaeon]
MKKRYVVLASMIVILFSTLSVSGDVESVTKSFTLRNFDVTFTFPKTVKPGDPATVSVSAVAKSSVRLVDVSIQVLAFTEGGDLQSIGSASLASNQYVSSGERLTKDLMVTVPANVPRSELTAVFSQTTASSYSYYSYYYPSYYYYGYYSSYYWYYPNYYSYYYPQTPSEQYVESKVLPCSYVLATTPEEAKLRSDYDTLNTQYNDLSTRYQQATEQNRQLSDKYSQATQDANNSKIMSYTLLGATVILAVLAAFLALHRHQKPAAQTSGSSGSPASQSSETKK